MDTIAGSALVSEIRKRFRWSVIPKVDDLYFLPTKEFVADQIIKASMKGVIWRKGTCDCDNIAVILWGKIEERECLEGWKYCMPFGTSFGTLANGRSHVTNCYYCKEYGFVFYDVCHLDVTGFKPSMILI